MSIGTTKLVNLDDPAGLSRGSGHHTPTPSLAVEPVPREEEKKNDLPQDITFCGYARHYFKKAPILGIMRSLPCL
jgi:hypothetical protein